MHPKQLSCQNEGGIASGFNLKKQTINTSGLPHMSRDYPTTLETIEHRMTLVVMFGHTDLLLSCMGRITDGLNIKVTESPSAESHVPPNYPDLSTRKTHHMGFA